MTLSPHSEKELNGPATETNAFAIRRQLKRLLAHPLFTNSKRYPVLLAYTVEQTLDGHASELKERTIGVEAFGRDPSYDVNLDPVVRTTAAEVRRRLAQYYYSAEHAGELVIELQAGSYVPIFREPAAPHSHLSPAPNLTPQPLKSAPAAIEPANPTPASARLSSRLILGRPIAIASGLLLAILAGFGLGRIRLPQPPSDLERFWSPVTSASGPITYCLGEPADTSEADRMNMSQGRPLNGGLDASDVTTLARSIVPLVPRHNVFRVVSASQTDFAQLREGPIVLIGAFDNVWTMRITQNLPFGFVTENNIRKLVERNSTHPQSWTLQWQIPNLKLAKDYAIVARFHDKVTGQPVIVLAGILGEGTEAASEVVSNPAYLENMLQKAPKNWDQMNLEAVIETDVIEGNPGPPVVLAVKTW